MKVELVDINDCLQELRIDGVTRLDNHQIYAEDALRLLATETKAFTFEHKEEWDEEEG